MITPILFALALLILVGLFIARPLITPQLNQPLPFSPLERLLAEKETLLTEIGELDFDYETGKLPQADYQHKRAGLVATAAVVLQKLDALQQGAGGDSRTSELVDDDIEVAVARLRQTPTSARRVTGVVPNGHGRFCTQCGQITAAEDRFCAACGYKLEQPQPT